MRERKECHCLLFLTEDNPFGAKIRPSRLKRSAPTLPLHRLSPMSTASTVSDLVSQPYKYGFVSDIETEKIDKGLSEDVVRLISAKKNEPALLAGIPSAGLPPVVEDGGAGLVNGESSGDRLSEHYLITPRPSNATRRQGLDEVDPKLLENLRQAGIPLSEQSDSATWLSMLFLTVFRLPPPTAKTGGARSGVLLHQ